MKHIIFGLLFIMVIFNSCDLIVIPSGDQPQYEYNIEEFMQNNGLTSLDSIWYWVDNNITYKKDNPESVQPWKYDDWQSPEETMVKRTGDCEDYSILMAYMLSLINIESTIIQGWVWVADHWSGYHCFLRINNKYIEPQSNKKYYNEVIVYKTYSIDYVIKEAISGIYRSVNNI